MSKRLSKVGPPSSKGCAPPVSRPGDDADEQDFDLASVCRAIIKDPTASATEKLRAADRLDQLGDGASNDPDFALFKRMRETAEVEIDRETIDPQTSHVIAVLCGPVPGQPEYFDPMSVTDIELHFPETAAAIRFHVGRWGATVGASDADPAGESTAGESVPREVVPQPEPSEVFDAEPVEQPPAVPSPPTPASTMERPAREPYHGWTSGYAA